MKNPSTTGSAGRSDPARDACGRPRAFHLLFFHTFHHFWFLRNHSPGGKVESWRILRLRWRLFSGLGCFLFFLPNWALCGPNRPLTGRRRVVPYLGWNLATRGLLGPNWGLRWFCGTAGCGWFPQCRTERKERKIPLEGVWTGLFQGCKEAMHKGVLFRFHTLCRWFCFLKHKMSKCAPYPFAPLHPSFFSQPIPLVGQADGLHIAS